MDKKKAEALKVLATLTARALEQRVKDGGCRKNNNQHKASETRAIDQDSSAGTADGN